MATPETPGQEPTTPETSVAMAQAAPEAGKDGTTFDAARAQALIEKLQSENKTNKAAVKELETLKAEKAEREEAELTESERLKKQAQEATDRATKLELQINQTKAATEAGLPAAWFDRLKGSTYDEMLADAQELAKTLPTLKIPPKLHTTDPAHAETTETDVQKRERLFGKQGNPMDLETIKARGGGVVWNSK